MCKYEMDPMSIVEDTERTRFCPQTDRQTDGQTDKVIPVYPPINFVEAGVIMKRPQAMVNSSPPTAAYMRQWIVSALIQIMACGLFGTKPLSKLMLVYFQLDP